MEDAVADLAAMALHEHGNRQLWFSKQITELQVEAEIMGAVEVLDAEHQQNRKEE